MLRTHLPRLVAPVLRQTRALQTSADASTLIGTLPSSSTEPFQIALHPEHFAVHNCATPELVLDVTKDSLVEMYRQMVTMRRMEMSAVGSLETQILHWMLILSGYEGLVVQSRMSLFPTLPWR
jgi:pyruvate dehydrogenase E1 component alpha subunit